MAIAVGRFPGCGGQGLQLLLQRSDLQKKRQKFYVRLDRFVERKKRSFPDIHRVHSVGQTHILIEFEGWQTGRLTQRMDDEMLGKQ
jgi:hypothetical protein